MGVRMGVYVNGRMVAVGEGATESEAEKEAARKAIAAPFL